MRILSCLENFTAILLITAISIFKEKNTLLIPIKQSTKSVIKIISFD